MGTPLYPESPQGAHAVNTPPPSTGFPRKRAKCLLPRPSPPPPPSAASLAFLGVGHSSAQDPRCPTAGWRSGPGMRGAEDMRNVAPGVSECPQRNCLNVVTEGSSIGGGGSRSPSEPGPLLSAQPTLHPLHRRMGSRRRPRAGREPGAAESAGRAHGAPSTVLRLPTLHTPSPCVCFGGVPGVP